MLSGNLLVVSLQAINFVLLARYLGPAEFGALATVNAAAAILIPVAGLGYGNVMLMRVSRDHRQAPAAAGNALAMQAFTGLLAAAAGTVVVAHISSFDVSWLLVMGVLVAELVLMRTSITAAQFFSALERYGRASVINVSASIVRVAMIGLAIAVFGKPDVVQWASVFFGGAVLYSCLVVALMKRTAGALVFKCQTVREDLASGLDFSFGTLAKAIYTDVDKLVLARFASAADVGVYASAYRIAVMSFSPIRAVLDASAARFFREGQAGLGSALRVSMGLFRVILPYTMLVAVVLYVTAQWLPLVFGDSFSAAVPILQLIAVLPVVQGIHYNLADALSGSGNQRARALAQGVVVVVYIGIAFVVIPRFGSTGAAYTCVTSELLLAVLIIGVVLVLKRRRHNKAEA